MGWQGAAELFATTLDAYLLLGLIQEDASDCDTADGRPATKSFAFARLCRMYGGDKETISTARIEHLAKWIYQEQLARLRRCEDAVKDCLLKLPSRRATGSHSKRLLEEKSDRPKLVKPITYIVSGSGEFLARKVGESDNASEVISLNERLGASVSACAPAYSVAVLAEELRK
jgi:hypothetical protein